MRTKRTKKSSPSIAAGSWWSSQSSCRLIGATSSDDDLVVRREEQGVLLQLDGLTPAADPAPVAQVVLEQLQLVDGQPPLDRLDHLGHRRGRQWCVERPPGAVG